MWFWHFTTEAAPIASIEAWGRSACADGRLGGGATCEDVRSPDLHLSVAAIVPRGDQTLLAGTWGFQTWLVLLGPDEQVQDARTFGTGLGTPSLIPIDGSRTLFLERWHAGTGLTSVTPHEVTIEGGKLSIAKVSPTEAKAALDSLLGP
jgi:hypothetical protein